MGSGMRGSVISAAPTVAEFWLHVSIPSDDPEGCWVWTARRDKGGYGRLRGLLAHRLSWSFVNGPIPVGLHVLHRCDNRPCVRSDHLFLGTNADNIADRMAKLRARGHVTERDVPRKRLHPNRTRAVGEHVNGAKLSAQDVLAIRHQYGTVTASRVALARSFGVSGSAIFNVVHRRTWKHIPDAGDRGAA